MFKNILLLAALACSLPTHATETRTTVLSWKLFHNGEEVDAQSFVPVLVGGTYHFKNLAPHRYNKASTYEGNKVKTISGDAFSGVELSLKPRWQDGLIVNYDINQDHLDGFTKLPGSLGIEVPEQRKYEARGASQILTIGDTELIRLGDCSLDTPVKHCPYHIALTVERLN